MNAWLPQASYPCGNFSDTSCLKLLNNDKRIDRPRFHGLYSYWKSKSSELLPFCSTRGFRPRWAHLRTPALRFYRCTAPVKLPAWHCHQSRSWALNSTARTDRVSPTAWRTTPSYNARKKASQQGRGRPPPNWLSKETIKVVVFHCRPKAPTYATPLMSHHRVKTRVKLNRVFFPRWLFQARSLGCGFAR